MSMSLSTTTKSIFVTGKCNIIAELDNHTKAKNVKKDERKMKKNSFYTVFKRFRACGCLVETRGMLHRDGITIYVLLL